MGEIHAVGSISFRTLVGSGEITSGNAGLFLLFFSFFIIIMSLSGIHKATDEEKRPSKSFSNAFKVFLGLLISLGICIVAAIKAEGEIKVVFGFLLFSIAYILLIWTCVMGAATMSSDD